MSDGPITRGESAQGQLSRRAILAGAVGAGTSALFGKSSAGAAVLPLARTPNSAEQIAAASPRRFLSPPVRTIEPVNMRIIAEGLRIPEGPVAMPDGTILFVEIEGQTLCRCHPDGRVQVIAELGGGPNGLAIGPDRAAYVTNNGGFVWAPVPGAGGLKMPNGDMSGYKGGSIQRIDLRTGTVTTLYDRFEGQPLSAPNDLVFDDHGGFWFTDMGKARPSGLDNGAVYYAKADGSSIRRMTGPLKTPNGITLSPDGTTLYVSQTDTGHVLKGAVSPGGNPASLQLGLFAAPGGNAQMDGMALETNGSIVAAVNGNGGLMRFSSDGSSIEYTPLPDWFTSNVVFGGADMRTCFVTLSVRGQIVALDWPHPGVAPRFVR